MISYVKLVPLMTLIYTTGAKARIAQSFESNIDVTGSRIHRQTTDSLYLFTVHAASCHTSTSLPEAVSSIAYPSRIANSLATTLSGVPADVPQSGSSFGTEPSAPTPGLHSRGSTDLSSHQRSVTTSPLRTSTYQPLPLAVTNVITEPSSDSDQLLETSEQAASSPENAFTSLIASPTSVMSAPQSAERPENALDVLLSALPSDIASSIEAGYNVLTQELAATSNPGATRPTFNPAGVSTSISQPTQHGSTSHERPQSEYTARPTTQPSDRPNRTSSPTADESSRPTSPPLIRPTSTPSDQPATQMPTTLSTMTSSTAISPSSTTTSTNASNSTTNAEATRPSVSPSQQQSNGTIAGVATGAAAGVVLIVLAVFFFLRRRQRKRAATPDPKQAFPEVAWLYDPPRSPPRSISPPPQIGAIAGIGPTRVPQRSSSSHAPEVVVPESEPLMAPGRAATRDNSPSGGGRGRSASPGGPAR